MAEMDKSSGNALKSGIWFIVSSFATKSIGLITTPIFTRLMTKSEYGDFSNFQTWVIIIMYISSLNLEASLLRACYEFKEDFNEYVHSVIILSILSTGICWAIFKVFMKEINQLLSMNYLYINCMFIYLFFQPAISIFQAAERFRYKYKMTVLVSMIISVGGSLLSVVLVIYMQNKLLGRILGYVIPVAAVGAVIVAYYFIKVIQIDVKYWKYALPIALPYIPHLLSLYLLNNMDKVMIRKICGAEDLGIYSLAYTCGMIITIFVSSVNSAFSPWMAEKLNKKDYQSLYRMSTPYVVIFSYISIGIVLVSPEILYFLGGKGYMGAKYVMPPVAAGCLLQFIYFMYVNIEQYEKKTSGMAVASLVAAVLNYVLNYVCISKFGYIAAAYTTLAGYFSLLLMHMYLVKRIGLVKVYNNKIIFIIAISSSAIIVLENFILNKMVIRYILFVAYATIGIYGVYKERHILKNVIHK